MKIIKDDNVARQDSLFKGGEPDSHYELRQHRVEEDSYTPIAGETDISTVENWHDIGTKLGCDYLCKTINITTITATTGFANLTSDEKDIAGIHIATDSATLITYYESLGMDTATATGYHSLRRLAHAEANALACEARYKNKAEGWFPIILSHFDEDIALQIMKSAHEYLSNYREYAQFGTLWGDTEEGILDFINDTGGVITALTDYTLISGTDYTAVQSALTKYFFA